LLTATKTQFIRRRYSSRDSPPNPANRAPNLKDILQDEYNKFVEASFHDQNGRPKFGDGYKDTEYFKKVNNIHHGIKLVMKDVELMMNNIDRSRKEEMDHLVEKVDEVQKVIALQRSLASGDGERGDGLENAMEEPEDEDGGDDLRDDDKNDDNNKEDDDLEIESDDLKQKLAALENKVDSLRMEFRYFRSQISADFTVKTIEKIFRLMDEKFPRDRCD